MLNFLEKKHDIFYIAALVMYMLCQILIVTYFYTLRTDYVFIVKILQLLRYGAYACLIIKLLYEDFEKKDFIIIAIIAAIVLLNAKYSGKDESSFFILIILLSRHMENKKIITITMLTQAFALGIMIVLSLANVVPDYVFTRDGVERHSFGFVYATFAPILMFFISLEYIYLRDTSMKLIEYIVLFLLNLILFYYTKTRMTFVLICAVLVFFFVFRNKLNSIMSNSIIAKLQVLFPAIAAVGSILACYYYDFKNDTWFKINEIVNGRLKLGHNGLLKYGVTLWGQPIVWIGNNYNKVIGKYNYVDCAYLQMLLSDGVVFLVMILAMYMFLIYRAIKNNDGFLACILVFICVLCITEPRLFVISFNPFPLLAGAVITGDYGIKLPEFSYKKVVQYEK